MISLLPLLLAGQLLLPDPPVRPRVFRSDGAARVTRLGSDDYAFFEAFPASGAGTTTACSTTAPTGAKGEAMTFSRGSVATCTKTASGGLATSGIANGDLVELSSNVARVEYDSAGVKGLRVEGSGQNVLTRFIDYTNAAWSDVGTPTPTASQASPFSGTYATSAVLYDDNDGAGFEGRSIPVAVTATSAYIAFCYVKAGTATSARIVLDGTAATITGLSSSTWSIIEVADASASAASVTFEVDVGSTAATTGSVVFGGCDVKLGVYRTSIVPTVAAAVTRQRDAGYFDIGASAPPANLFSSAVSVVDRAWTAAMGSVIGTYLGASTISGVDGSKGWSLRTLSSGATWGCRTADEAGSAVNSGTAALQGTRVWCSGNNSVSGAYGTNSMSASGAQPGTYAAARYINLGYFGGDAVSADAILTQICVDPSPARCR